jgi:hypothetical protein
MEIQLLAIMLAIEKSTIARFPGDPNGKIKA